MKKYFITGLIILLPLAVTFGIAVFFFNLLTEPLAGAIAHLLDRYDLLESDHLFFSGRQIQYFASQLFTLVFFFFFAVLVGMITRYLFVNYLFGLWDYVIHKIPLVRTIYKTSQDVITTIFSSKESAFKQVVLAPFPHPEAYSIGFLTQKNIKDFREGQNGTKVAVFIPATPNPTSGFLMLYEEKDLVYLDMKVEDAFKYVVSCGVINMPFNVTTIIGDVSPE